MRSNKHNYDDELGFTAIASLLWMLVLVIAGGINDFTINDLVLVIAGGINDFTINDGQKEYVKTERMKAMSISIEEYKHRFDTYKNVDKSTVNMYTIVPQVFR